MGWNKVGKKGGDSLPIVKIEAGKPVRIRLLPGPGKLAEPEDRWQHWPDGEAAKIIKSPIMCCGPRNGCIFHTEPLKWRTNKQFVMNAIVYEIDPKNGAVISKKIQVLSGNQIYDFMQQQANMVGIVPDSKDWLIGKTGTGKNTTYSVSMCPNLLDGEAVDLSQFEDQDPEFQMDGAPKFIDYDKFEGFKVRTPAQQEEWFEKAMAEGEPPAEDGGAAAAGTVTPPAAPTGTMTVGKPAAAAAPPAPKAKAPTAAKPAITLPPPGKAAAPPPKAAPAAAPAKPSLDECLAKADPWDRGPLGDCPDSDLAYIIENAATLPADAVEAAEIILTSRGAGGAPQAATAAPAGDEAALRAQLSSIIVSSPTLKGYTNMKAFFALAGPDKKALAGLDLNDITKLLDIAAGGEDAIKAAIGI